jgi:pimeloyl-ACP methyl ester carboxylesterase
MAAYDLVHGGGHGGWCWDRLVPLLREAGHQVFAPTLRGVGERLGEGTPDLTLHDHIDEVAQLIARQVSVNVILGGHSYGGMVIIGVAGQVRERVRSLFISTPLSRTTGKRWSTPLPDAWSCRARLADHRRGRTCLVAGDDPTVRLRPDRAGGHRLCRRQADTAPLEDDESTAANARSRSCRAHPARDHQLQRDAWAADPTRPATGGSRASRCGRSIPAMT